MTKFALENSGGIESYPLADIGVAEVGVLTAVARNSPSAPGDPVVGTASEVAFPVGETWTKKSLAGDYRYRRLQPGERAVFTAG